MTNPAGAVGLADSDSDPNAMEIDLGAVAANFRAIKQRLGLGRRIIGVIKADAYGHGALAVARTLGRLGVAFLASGSLKECIALQRAGISTPIVLLGALTSEAIPDVIHNRPIPSLDNAAAARELSRAAPSSLPVFIKVDCGFGRFGIPVDQAAAFVEYVSGLPRLRVEGIYTHLPFSDSHGRSWAERQTKVFDILVSELAAHGMAVPISQSQASPGLFTGLIDNGNATAIGHLLYGLSPIGDKLAKPRDFPSLRPALRLIRARLIHIGAALPGVAAAPYLRQRHGRVGVVSIGIQHGYRPVSDSAFMLIRGSRVPLLRVCLENTVVDLAQLSEAEIGDQVVVVGSMGGLGITLQDLATWQSTSPLALLTAFGRSLTRNYTDK